MRPATRNFHSKNQLNPQSHLHQICWKSNKIQMFPHGLQSLRVSFLMLNEQHHSTKGIIILGSFQCKGTTFYWQSGATIHRLTSAISLTEVSAPRLKSVPGTLLLIVAGTTTIGMQNSGYLSRSSAIISTLWNAFSHTPVNHGHY